MKTFFSFRNLKTNMLLSAVLYLFLTFNLKAKPAPWLLSLGTDSLPHQESTRTTTYSNGSTTYNVSIKGKISLTDDERDIKSITPGGYFRYSQITFGNKREVYIQSESNGALKRQYFIGRTEEPYEPAGREWLAEALQELIKSGFGAPERVERIYAKNGFRGVLGQIYEFDSDYAKSIYTGYLIQHPNLKDNEMRVLLNSVVPKIESSHEKSQILQKVNPKFLQDERLLTSYLTAVNTISSDHDKCRVLGYALKNGKLTPESYNQVLLATGKITSDYDQARILKQVLANPDLTTQAHKQAIAMLPTISSDYEKAGVIVSLASKKEYVNANFGELLNATTAIKSDYEKGKVLNKIISSSPKLTTAQYLQVLPLVTNITSDYDKAKVLLQLKPNLPLSNPEVRAEYVKVAKTLKSDHEYRRAIDGLL